MGKFLQCLTELSARNMIMAGFYSLMFLYPDKKSVQINNFLISSRKHVMGSL